MDFNDATNILAHEIASLRSTLSDYEAMIRESEKRLAVDTQAAAAIQKRIEGIQNAINRLTLEKMVM